MLADLGGDEAMAGWLGTLWRRQAVYTVLGLALVALIPVLSFLALIDERMVDGINVWVKPLKFSASIGIYLLTLAFFAAWMRPGAMQTRPQRLAVVAVAVAVVYEMGWLIAASAHGVRSHFNMDGGLFMALYPLAGLFAFVLVIGPLAMGASVLRARPDAANPAMSEAIGLGLVLTFILTPLVAFPLSNPLAALGGSQFGYGEGYFGWHMERGDLRAAHFFATHALHVIPALAFLPSRLLRGAAGVAICRVTAIVYAAFVGGLAWLGITGQPLPAILRAPF